MGQDFSGKVAVVTGAAMGIGLGVAELLAASGARVVMVDLDRDRLLQEETQLRSLGREVLAVHASVSDSASMAEVMATANRSFGGVDVVAGCAGVVRYGNAEDQTEDEWDLQIDTNLKALYLAAKHAVPYMRARGGGVFVQLASIQAFVTQSAVTAYTASKGGVVALVRSIAVDYAADGIRAVAVAPASVDTPMLRQAAAMSATETHSEQDVLDDWAKSHPLGRLLQVEDVAKLVAFLASDDASMITGTTVTIDGGLLSQNAVRR
jgi:NAD(P)-dependent dehydrogenase (short-subunit alcohol dehydrogenase family)